MKSNITAVIAYTVFFAICNWFMIIAPAQRDMQADCNLKAAMPHAEREYGLRRPQDYANFRNKVRNFEDKEGFKGEAEMEAARIVLDISPGYVYCLLKDDCDE